MNSTTIATLFAGAGAFFFIAGGLSWARSIRKVHAQLREPGPDHVTVAKFDKVELQDEEGIVSFVGGPEAQRLLMSCPNHDWQVWGWRTGDTEPCFTSVLRFDGQTLRQVG